MTACLWALAAIGAVVLAIVAFVYGALCGTHAAINVSVCADRAKGNRNDVVLAWNKERFSRDNVNMAIDALGWRGVLFPGRRAK